MTRRFLEPDLHRRINGSEKEECREKGEVGSAKLYGGTVGRDRTTSQEKLERIASRVRHSLPTDSNFPTKVSRFNFDKVLATCPRRVSRHSLEIPQNARVVPSPASRSSVLRYLANDGTCARRRCSPFQTLLHNGETSAAFSLQRARIRHPPLPISPFGLRTSFLSISARRLCRLPFSSVIPSRDQIVLVLRVAISSKNFYLVEYLPYFSLLIAA